MTEQLAHDLRKPAVGSVDQIEIERLDETECWRLLAGTPVGRVGVVVDGAAEIYPVNYIVDRSCVVAPTILFRTDPGTKPADLAQNPRISFERLRTRVR